MVSQTVIASFQLISQAGKFFLKYSWTYQPQTVWTVATAFLKLGKVAGRNETLGMVTWAINYSNDNDVFFEVQTVQWFRLKPIRTWSAWAWRQRRETRVSHGVLASEGFWLVQKIAWGFSANHRTWQRKFIHCVSDDWFPFCSWLVEKKVVRFFSQSQSVAKQIHLLWHYFPHSFFLNHTFTTLKLNLLTPAVVPAPNQCPVCTVTWNLKSSILIFTSILTK